jgi:hypothetical protein
MKRELVKVPLWNVSGKLSKGYVSHKFVGTSGLYI